MSHDGTLPNIMNEHTRVSLAVSSVRGELSSHVALRDVDLGEIANTGHLIEKNCHSLRINQKAWPELT